MAKSNNPIELSNDVIIEVVRTKIGEPTVKKEMTFGEWKRYKKLKGYVYIAYQLGVSSYPELEIKN